MSLTKGPGKRTQLRSSRSHGQITGRLLPCRFKEKRRGVLRGESVIAINLIKGRKSGLLTSAAAIAAIASGLALSTPVQAQSAGCLFIQGGALTQNATLAAIQHGLILNAGEVIVFGASNPNAAASQVGFKLEETGGPKIINIIYNTFPQSNIFAVVVNTGSHSVFNDPQPAANSRADVTTNCLLSLPVVVTPTVSNPTDGATLDSFSTSTGFAGIGGLNTGLTTNVRTRFFGGNQFAESGQGFQLASVFRGSGLSQIAQNKVAVTPEGRMRWSAWLKGSGTYLRDSAAGANYDGNLFSLTGGIDYLINDNLLVGMLAGYEDFKLDTTFNTGSFKGNGFSVGPYAGFRFLKRFVLDAMFAYTWLNSNVNGTSGGTTASGGYNSTRWLAAANLSGHWRLRKSVRLSPAVGVVYAEEKREAFTNSAGQTTTAAKTKLGRVSFGPEVGVTVYRRGRSYVEPYVSFKGQYDFATRGRLVLSSGAIVAARKKLSGRIGFGLNARLNRLLTARVGGFYDGIGQDNFHSWTGEARIRIKW